MASFLRTNFSLVLILGSLPLFAQTNQNNDLSLAFNLGYGDQTKLAIDYRHYTHHVQAEIHYAFFKKEQFDISFLGMPHFILTDVAEIDAQPKLTRGYEFGINGGFMFRWKLWQEAFNLYFLISSGPHFVSHAPERQSTGYIFSDNFFVGIQIKLAPKLYFDFRPGFRHISNAELQFPNGGVNSIIYNAGVVYKL